MLSLFYGVDLGYNNGCSSVESVANCGVVMAWNSMERLENISWVVGPDFGTYLTNAMVLPSLMNCISCTIWYVVSDRSHRSKMKYAYSRHGFDTT